MILDTYQMREIKSSTQLRLLRQFGRLVGKRFLRFLHGFASLFRGQIILPKRPFLEVFEFRGHFFSVRFDLFGNLDRPRFHQWHDGLLRQRCLFDHVGP